MEAIVIPHEIYFELIENENRLKETVETIISSQRPIGFDLETNSIYVYKNRICLVQIESAGQIYLIDTLKIKNKKWLIELLENETIQKVFQDMQFDLAILRDEFDCSVSNVFDISICDRLIQYKSNHASLELLEETYLGSSSSTVKKLQKSNWGIRPLAKNQLQYAANDVQNLVNIRNVMVQFLSGSFHLEAFTHFMNCYQVTSLDRSFNINFMWNKKVMLKNPDLLSQNTLYRLKRVLEIREETAEHFDKPSHWIIPDQKLLKLAESRFTKGDQVIKIIGYRNIKPFHRFVANKIANLKITDSAENIQQPPIGTSFKRWKSNQEEKIKFVDINFIKAFKEWSKVCSARVKILPEFLYDKKSTSLRSILSKSSLSLIEFPGIPKNYEKLFIDDLKYFLEADESEILLEDLEVTTNIDYR